MKTKALIYIALLSLVPLLAQVAQGQGTLYLSNIDSPTPKGHAVGNNSWLAQEVETGNDSSGYILNSVELEMSLGAGNPSGFSVSVYSDLNGSPSSDLGALSGPSNPLSAGIYSYTSSGLPLAPSTEYFIVVTAATATPQNSYAWIFNPLDAPVTSVDGWAVQENLGSTDGTDWTGLRAYGFQTAVYATAVPEPSSWVLCLVGGVIAWFVRAVALGNRHSAIPKHQ